MLIRNSSRDMKTNGKIPLTPMEELLDKRIGWLKKMIKRLPGEENKVYRTMWRDKLRELSREIDKKTIFNSTMELKKTIN